MDSWKIHSKWTYFCASLLGINPKPIKFNGDTNNYLSGLWIGALPTPVCYTHINSTIWLKLMEALKDFWKTKAKHPQFSWEYMLTIL